MKNVFENKLYFLVLRPKPKIDVINFNKKAYQNKSLLMDIGNLYTYIPENNIHLSSFIYLHN